MLAAKYVSTIRLRDAVIEWVKTLDNYPGWKEWKRKQLGKTLWYDDPYEFDARENLGDFEFDEILTAQHAVAYQYLCLLSTVNSFKDLEYYFRRYPFRDLPVTRHEHLANVCEMYFSRFYEFRSRAKGLLNAANMASPTKKLDVGKFIKSYDRLFDSELRERNRVHHAARFSDIEIDSIMINDLLSRDSKNALAHKREHMRKYRQAVRQWSERVRNRGRLLDDALEKIAAGVLEVAPFIGECAAGCETTLDAEHN